MEHTFANGRRLQLVTGDITKVPVDAIANAANSRLAGGGGVDGAIHRAGGPAIMHELDIIRDRQGGCRTGSAVSTTAGNLPAKFVFHAVGPIWEGGEDNESGLLASCYRTCLDLAAQHGVRTISFPSISTGVYGYPVQQAAGIAIRTVADRLRENPGPVESAIFVLFDDRTHRAYAEALSRYTERE